MAHRTKPRLTPLQRAFVQAFISSDDPHVRHNGTAAYLAACQGRVSAATARANAARMLAKASIQAAIEAFHVQAEAELLIRLVDWKMAAIEAQPILLNLARGRLVDGRLITTTHEAAAAHVMLGAIKEVMDRGFPKQFYIKFDARAALARLLGVPRESLPDTLDDDEGQP